MLQKIEHYISALAQLEQAVAIYQKSRQDALYRDGLIQRFEFTVELAWKSIKEYLEDQGSTTPIATPRAVLKEAFAAGLSTMRIRSGHRTGGRNRQPSPFVWRCGKRHPARFQKVVAEMQRPFVLHCAGNARRGCQSGDRTHGKENHPQTKTKALRRALPRSGGFELSMKV